MSTHEAYVGPLSAFERSLPPRDKKVHLKAAVRLACQNEQVAPFRDLRGLCPEQSHTESIADSRSNEQRFGARDLWKSAGRTLSGGADAADRYPVEAHWVAAESGRRSFHDLFIWPSSKAS